MTEVLKKKIESGREYRALATNLEPIEEAAMIVEGYATTFDQPYYLYSFEDERGVHVVREQVARNAFEKTDMTDVIMQFDHEGRVFARNSNGTLELAEDDHGMKVRAILGGTALGRSLYEDISGGYVTKMSFGFTVTDDEVAPDGTQDYLRTIKSIGKLFDVSAVSYPQNGFTEIQAVRSYCDGEIAKIEAERLHAAEVEREKSEKRESLLRKIAELKGEEHGS